MKLTPEQRKEMLSILEDSSNMLSDQQLYEVYQLQVDFIKSNYTGALYQLKTTFNKAFDRLIETINN